MVTGIGCVATTQTEVRQPQYSEVQQPQEVLGTMVVAFIPTALASLPEPPFDLTLFIKSLAGGYDIKYHIADDTQIWELITEAPSISGGASYQNFRLMLPSGDYSMEGLGIQAKSLSDKPFFLVSGGQNFTVPKGNCVYIGRIGVLYSRLPPGSLDQAKT